MTTKINLHGEWKLALDQEQVGIDQKWYQSHVFEDTITLPTTLSEAKKTPLQADRPTGYLTDPYAYAGFAWYAKSVFLEADTTQQDVLFSMERTRVSRVWINGKSAGTHNSLCTAHVYDITHLLKKGENDIVVMIDNANYPVPGGHMTSADTQTNWNGILGDIELVLAPKTRLTEIQLYPSAESKCVQVRATLLGKPCTAKVLLKSENFLDTEQIFLFQQSNIDFTYKATFAPLWDEHHPTISTLVISLYDGEMLVDCYEESFGFRDFYTNDKDFYLNGCKIHLRGKHDGLLFPKTGYAPMEVESWISVLQTAKNYGINHYRFHTCCPPRAAFVAADMLGIYMEPELPFWGTITDTGEENHDESAQQYLIEEGFRLLKEFGNHPSFMMMSLGNELWGSKERLNRYLKNFKEADSRRLYTEGSNNFQFVPTILEHDDFHVGVRFSRDRLFRGSYAMCDAPLGKVQTAPPSTDYDYDEMIRPKSVGIADFESGEIQIQYGTGVKTVTAQAGDELCPSVPVVSHEIGQYNMYPDYREIERYTGVLRAYNFEIFRERLQNAGMLHQAHDFFLASGHFAVDCYQMELEAALRSQELAGFQILDLQDFTGQGTALVGVLNSMMESKGLVTEEQWRTFCAQTVLLGRLPSFVYHAGDVLKMPIQLYHYGIKAIQNPTLTVNLLDGDKVLDTKSFTISATMLSGLFDLAVYTKKLPTVQKAQTHTLQICLLDMVKEYTIWLYPDVSALALKKTILATNRHDMLEAVKKGSDVLYIAQDGAELPHIKGTYCTDFWNYTMFRIISEELGKPEPIGTLGLLIDTEHPALFDFPTKFYTTPQWYDIIESSFTLIMDTVQVDPIVQFIDNVERNHRLGLLWEARVGNSKILMCTSDIISQKESAPAQQLFFSLTRYVESDRFNPQTALDMDSFSRLFV